MGEWYCKLSGAVCGPFAWEEILFLRDRGKLGDQDFLREGTAGPWRPAQAIPELFSAASPPPAGRPMPAAANSPPPPPGPAPSLSAVAPTVAISVVPTQAPTVHARAIPRRAPAARSPRAALLIGTSVGLAIALLLLAVLLLLLRTTDSGQLAGGGSGSGEGLGLGNATQAGSGGSGDPGPGESGAGGQDESDPVAPPGKDADSGGPEPSATPAKSPPPRTLSRKEPPPRASLFALRQAETAETPPADALEGRMTAGRPRPAGKGTGGGGSGGGGLGDFESRLRREGAKTGDVQISLIWNNFNDLDLHVICPSGEQIFFQHRRCNCQGELDVDMNAGGPQSNKPVENIFWPPRQAPRGRYQVYVHHFAPHGSPDPTAYRVAVKVGGRTETFSGHVSAGQLPVLIHTFSR